MLKKDKRLFSNQLPIRILILCWHVFTKCNQTKTTMASAVYIQKSKFISNNSLEDIAIIFYRIFGMLIIKMIIILFYLIMISGATRTTFSRSIVTQATELWNTGQHVVWLYHHHRKFLFIYKYVLWLLTWKCHYVSPRVQLKLKIYYIVHYFIFSSSSLKNVYSTVLDLGMYILQII